MELTSGPIANPAGPAPAMPAAVRKRVVWLLLLFGLAVGTMIPVQWPDFLTNLQAGTARALWARDFTAFYSAAQMVNRGELVAIYDIDVLSRAMQVLSGLQIYNSWAYPPPVFFAMAPLAHVSELTGFWIFVLAPVGVLALALARFVPWPIAGAVACFFPAMFLNVYTANTGSFTAAFIAGGLAALVRAPILAGALFALAAYKPHLALIIPLVLIATRSWRALSAMAATGVVIVIASLLAHGIEPWLAFVAKIPVHLEYVTMRRPGLVFPEDRLPTAYVAVLMQTDARAVAFAVQTVVSILAIAGTVWVWRRTEDLTIRALALAATVLLATPYAFDYDMAVLAIPFALLLAEGRRQGWPASTGALLILFWLGPAVAWTTVRALGVQLVPVLLLALLAYALVQAEAARNRHSSRPASP